MQTIQPGVQIEVTDALGRTLLKRAVSDVDDHGAFAVVWACTEQEWADAEAEGRDVIPDPFPWPVESVRVVELA
jgi:hypothetical protein